MLYILVMESQNISIKSNWFKLFILKKKKKLMSHKKIGENLV